MSSRLIEHLHRLHWHHLHHLCLLPPANLLSEQTSEIPQQRTAPLQALADVTAQLIFMKFNKLNIRKHNRNYVRRRLENLKKYKDYERRMKDKIDNRRLGKIMLTRLAVVVILLHQYLYQIKTAFWIWWWP